ncbi:MAG: carbon-nitrogen hydrolase family protein [Propioniciclava sp.]|uniref:carbon-nitrogen hydrolase family protein n=1 Tax=Propioniciclava sp. TaxID=2038686 RepID=UPI0039E3A633
MRIAVSQVVSGVAPGGNLDLIRDCTRRAKDAGAELVVFPEATMASFATRSAEVAEPLDGEWANGVLTVARELEMTIVAGMFTPAREAAGGRPRARNTLLVADASGVVAHYDKMHLFEAWGFEESRHIEAGDRPVTFTCGGITFGLATCYEVRFPELFKYLALAGAQVVLVAASWMRGERKIDQWRALTVARALDSTCYIVAAGQGDPATVGLTVKPDSPTGVGHSVVVSPLGDILAEADAAPALLIADLDPAVVADARARLPVLATSRFTIAAP